MRRLLRMVLAQWASRRAKPAPLRRRIGAPLAALGSPRSGMGPVAQLVFKTGAVVQPTAR